MSKFFILLVVFLLMVQPVFGLKTLAEKQAGTSPNSAFNKFLWKADLWFEKVSLALQGKERRYARALEILDERKAELEVLEAENSEGVVDVSEAVDDLVVAESIAKRDLMDRGVFSALERVKAKLEERGLKSALVIQTNIERIREKSKK